jgi:hypothetical protein
MTSKHPGSIPISPLGSIVAAASEGVLDGRKCALLVVKATFAAPSEGGVMTLARPEPIDVEDAAGPPRVVRARHGARPDEQPIAALRGDEWVDFASGGAGAPLLRGHLPKVRASALVHGLGSNTNAAGDAPRRVDLGAEVLRIDDAHRRCTLTFRATIPLPVDASAVRVVAALGVHGNPPLLPDAIDDDGDLEELGTLDVVPDSEASLDEGTVALPARSAESTLCIEPGQAVHAAHGAALPFVSAPASASPFAQSSGAPPPRVYEDGDHEGTLALDPNAAAEVMARPALPFGAARAPASPAPVPASAPPDVVPDGTTEMDSKSPLPAAPATPAPAPAPPKPEPRAAVWAAPAEAPPAAAATAKPKKAPRAPDKPDLKGDIYGGFTKRKK